MNARRLASAGVLLAALALISGAQQFSGAIYTTKSDGQTVNANLYDNKADVYLNGGPKICRAAGCLTAFTTFR